MLSNLASKRLALWLAGSLCLLVASYFAYRWINNSPTKPEAWLPETPLARLQKWLGMPRPDVDFNPVDIDPPLEIDQDIELPEIETR